MSDFHTDISAFTKELSEVCERHKNKLREKYSVGFTHVGPNVVVDYPDEGADALIVSSEVRVVKYE